MTCNCFSNYPAEAAIIIIISVAMVTPGEQGALEYLALSLLALPVYRVPVFQAHLSRHQFRGSNPTVIDVRGLGIKSWQLLFPSHLNDDTTK